MNRREPREFRHARTMEGTEVVAFPVVKGGGWAAVWYYQDEALVLGRFPTQEEARSAVGAKAAELAGMGFEEVRR